MIEKERSGVLIIKMTLGKAKNTTRKFYLNEKVFYSFITYISGMHYCTATHSRAF